MPTEAMPTEAMPTEAMPTEAMPTEAMPTEAMPTERSAGISHVALQPDACTRMAASTRCASRSTPSIHRACWYLCRH